MKAIDVIRNARQISHDFTLQFLEDMRDAALMQPTPRGGNHPLWIAGHLALSEGQIAEMLLGESNPVEHWKPLFDAGTEPTATAAAYPSFDEVVTRYRELHTRNSKLLEQTGDAGLDRPAQAPMEGAEEFFGTFGQTFVTMLMHQEFHCGQIADARRAAGRKPLFR